jgi:hypothetical protein
MEQNSTITSSLAQYELTAIYGKLIVKPEIENLDTDDDKLKIESYINEIYDQKFKQIETEELQNSVELLNEKFVVLLKFCIDKKFEKFSIIFVVFIDYFNLEPNKTFISLHEKLQNIIKNDFKKLVGKSIFNKYNKLIPKTNFPTLFDLIKK